jgi:hypothetical protein
VKIKQAAFLILALSICTTKTNSLDMLATICVQKLNNLPNPTYANGSLLGIEHLQLPPSGPSKKNPKSLHNDNDSKVKDELLEWLKNPKYFL